MSDAESDRPFGADDAAALDAFVRAHRDATVQIALSVLGPGAANEAEDVAHEVLLRTFRRRAAVRSPRAIRSWIARSTVHAAISLRRRARWRRPHDAIEAQPEGAFGVTDPRDGADRAVRAQVMVLPDHERVAVHLHYWMGYSSSEIADLLGCAEATVRSRLMRARRRLQRAMMGAMTEPAEHPPAEGRRKRRGS